MNERKVACFNWGLSYLVRFLASLALPVWGLAMLYIGFAFGFG